MSDFPSVLHYSTGFPLVIGLHHVENYKKIKVSDEGAKLTVLTKSGYEVTGFGVVHGYHHYFITTRPRCMFDKDSFYWDAMNSRGYGNLEFEVGYKKYRKVPFQLLLDGSSPYPFPQKEGLDSAKDIIHAEIQESEFGFPNRVVLKTKSGVFGFFLEPDFLHYISVDDQEFPNILDFKVEYIGISTGETGNRDFGDRLWNHEKVREVSGIIQRDSPNLQVYVFGFSAKYVVEPRPGGFIHNSGILEAKIGKHNAAKVLEAGLIKYFQPRYNDEFKSFLDEEHPSWLETIREILVPSWERGNRPAFLSITVASDGRFNTAGAWTFGRFYTEHLAPVDTTSFLLDLGCK
ncbi:hypothetical protein DFS28_104273 [Pseudomonas sp. 478]|uniref:hypothetical protein n=1 Tax=unclassified Pseudomonas TaxID=196821 RepID=UPI000DACC595|nr:MULTISPECIES: hypothetical protein [unclassified Pseudomonas]PZW98151.1 hypothetical protein DFS28_104273 [Pseudomonas sp. 478]TCV56631.1 hypothetical protein EDB99_101130 [Pseudomonas sp. 460]